MKWEQRNPIIPYKRGDNIVTKLLKIRGISNEKEFLNPTINCLNSPYLLANIEFVAERIVQAIKNNEEICISADCDSDGVFSTAIMYRYLSQFTKKLRISYNQRSKGHGVENQLEFIPSTTQLLIIVDSSTNSADACQKLSQTMDIVILDHHGFEQENPYATIINPQLDDYPNKGISGAGVVFKTLQVVDDIIGSGMVEEYADLVACGMYSDMMPVNILENRYLIINGMKNVRNAGLLSILKANNISINKVDSQTIGFTISPLINGCARMDKIELAIDLLLCDDMKNCEAILKEMQSVNERRKEIEKELFEKYMKTIDHNAKVIVAIDEIESKGFNGLIANKLANEFQRPAMVMRDHEGSLAGSYRSYAEFPMKEVLNDKKVKKFIKYAQGHEYAGGIGLKKENFNKFYESLESKIEEYNFELRTLYDLAIPANEISLQLIKDLEKFDYLTGEGFPKSGILVSDLFVESNPAVLGKTKETIKIKCDGLDVLKFKVNEDWANDVGVFDSIDVIGQLKINEWTNWRRETTITCQIIAEDYKFSK